MAKYRLKAGFAALRLPDRLVRAGEIVEGDYSKHLRVLDLVEADPEPAYEDAGALEYAVSATTALAAPPSLPDLLLPDPVPDVPESKPTAKPKGKSSRRKRSK